MRSRGTPLRLLIRARESDEVCTLVGRQLAKAEADGERRKAWAWASFWSGT